MALSCYTFITPPSLSLRHNRRSSHLSGRVSGPNASLSSSSSSSSSPSPDFKAPSPPQSVPSSATPFAESRPPKPAFNHAFANSNGNPLVRMVQNTESSIERVIFDFRFLALLAVGGSLAGSLLCFLNEWLKSYSHRRYGKAIHQVEAAWEILYHTIYNCTDGIADHNHDYIVVLPDWDPSPNIVSKHQKKIYFLPPGNRRSLFQKTPTSMPQAHLWYPPEEVVKALQLFLAGGKNLEGSVTYRYDLVDLTRQVLSKFANEVYIKAVTSFQKKNIDDLHYHSSKFLQLIKDIDLLLASDDNFLLGTWLESAKKLAMNPREMKQYEWNARTQVTMWFDTNDTTQSKLHDYANKFWSGLLENYYLPRASTYFSHLSESLRQNEKFKLIEWRKQWISMSNKWQEGNELYPVKAKGDALTISQALYEKYFA